MRGLEQDHQGYRDFPYPSQADDTKIRSSVGVNGR
ncbi:hypothetical protein cce_0346 [Crocosphaera subtropica ATCC 51142]|uniref:Uncharacterized protein n=1 Tax=Crocosphaera subtropica (strain ATCC 51142 / BH68) TaxID=43989 RepID=B1X156_CROS5|nr:hypothetical protein cce_0346 [Crocosphaera subtropica ATCC 51142]